MSNKIVVPPAYGQNAICSFLFSFGRGYWRIRMSYWVVFGLAVASCFTVIGVVPAIFVFVLLSGMATDSKKQWQNVELQQAIRSSAQPKQIVATPRQDQT